MEINFALDRPWMLVASIGIIFLISLFLFIFRKNKNPDFKKTVLVSNLDRFTLTPEYNRMLKSYRKGIVLTIVTIVIILLSSSVLSSKPVRVETTTPTKYNRDIVLCLDVSGSMLSVDEAILETFEELLKDFKGERIALVIWNNSSTSMFPLTDDYDYIKEQVNILKESINPKMNSTDLPYDYYRYTLNNEGGSLIGDGLTACSLSFDNDDAAEERSKSIILATDNIVNGNEIVNLDEASQFASDEQIKIYGIRPTTGYELGGEEESMRKAVESTGGIFYPLGEPEAVKGIVEAISAEEAGAIKGEPVIAKVDSPTLWVIIVSFLTMISMGLMWRFKI